ncbi:MAG: pilus assembly protein N-terminal domain-containing protein [Gammaproteobacteria bacterium]|nr:pilus assembly protein N-terminal domain-containing protein [Gammaproteobacteria bacterium]
MKKIILAFLLLLHSVFAWAQEELTPVTSITVYVGEIKILEVGAVDRVAVGKGDVISTTLLDNGQLLILAETEGETSVHLWYSDGAESDLKVHVLQSDQDRIVHELRVLLADFKGVEVRKVGEKVFLTGSIEKADESILATVKEAYKDVIDLTRKVEPAVQVQFQQAQNKMVYMDVKITEFNISQLKQLGIDWSDAVAGPSAGVVADAVDNRLFRASPDADLIPSFTGSLTPDISGSAIMKSSPIGYFGLVSEITSRIQLLESTGDAIILAEPKLSSRSGGVAEFLAGGEIPIVTTGNLGSSNTEFKEFGIKLNISPLVDDENTIMAKVSTEISAVDASNAVGGVPAFITRRTSTDVFMHDQETLVMSGLIDRDISENVEQIPLLGDIPVIGALFRSTNWNNNKTELVIFVTPTVYDAKSQLNQHRVGRRQEMFDKFKNAIEREDLILDDY